MSEQGKNVIVGKCEKCKGDLYMTHNGCCSTHYTCFDCGHFYEVDEYAAAEATAADYAKQAAELQEHNKELRAEVERLRGDALVLATWVDDVNSSRADEAMNFKELNDSAQRLLALVKTETE